MDILHHAKLFKYVETYLLANVKDDVKEADREALSQIQLHTSPYVKTFIATETAKDAWDTLKQEFEVTGATSWVFVTNRNACVTCHTRHTSVTDFRPKSGNPVEVTLVTSPKLYIVSHAKGTDFP